MDRQRILKEAQQIAKEFSFWMVSGNVAHLYGYAYQDSDNKFELEIKFDDSFPNSPPQMIYTNVIKELLGDFKLDSITNWKVESTVVEIVKELKAMILNKLKPIEEIPEDQAIPIEEVQTKNEVTENEEYITPDLNTYPPDFQYEGLISNSDPIGETINTENSIDQSSKDFNTPPLEKPYEESDIISQAEEQKESSQTSVVFNTELSLIQQIYAYDQSSPNKAIIDVYITVTLSKTFVISINFTNYPKLPIIDFPDEIKKILNDPYRTLNTLKNWNDKNPVHIVDVLHELENKLFFIKDIESQSKQISGEYQTEKVAESLTALRVHLLTYGFKEYPMEIDLEPYPKPPVIDLSPELQEIIQIPISDLNSSKNWVENETDPVEVVREISWLVDKNSRINFELDLLKDHYKNITYDSSTAILNVEMKGKMKTEDLTFQFQINLPIEYPMKMPEVKVVNEFDLEAHEKIKNDLHASFDDFFDEWTPFSYLVDLFNLISKKIFEVSVISCVICHKIECPSCTKKIAGDDSCHAECPHCNRAYHRHCWEQTIQSFGKCGFCLR
ncbi:MAG: hypothetical protein ACXACX_19120 [Candidatus Hodarchaeales archaeon]|jgi:ubiquitin-protein ligase